MGNIQNDITIVKGNLRYKGASERLASVPIELVGDRKELIDSDRISNINAAEQTEVERQASTTFRIGGKISNIFSNVISGTTNYDGYKNFLYLTNPLSVVSSNQILFNNFERVPDTFGLKWGGLPQYNEFNFIRTDVENPHNVLQPQSASTYNWGVYLSYPFSSDTKQQMSYVDKQINGTPLSFVVSDGIPFTIINTIQNGVNYITFRCAGNHNLTTYQYVELSINYNGNNLFRVDLLGEQGYDNIGTSFSIVNPGYTGTTFVNGVSGTFKRIGDISNSGESKSRYYVRLHKILTNENESDVSKMGFEHIPFSNQQKVEYSALTPNLQQRVSIKENSQSYSFTFKKDLNIYGMVDNNMKPVTDVFVTIVNKGYYGWFNKPTGKNTNALQKGWSFNFHSDSLDDWWVTDDNNNLVNIPVSFYDKVLNGETYTFFYNQPLKIDDILSGDFCEYNDIEQMEYVVSNCKHKIIFNDVLYTTQTPTSNNPPGYFYNPHSSVKLRDFADSVTEAVGQNVNTRPSWAYFSQNLNTWLWRTILDYGVFENGNGVDYPFLNDAHYPFSQILFTQSTPYSNINQSIAVTAQPIKDFCE